MMIPSLGFYVYWLTGWRAYSIFISKQTNCSNNDELDVSITPGEMRNISRRDTTLEVNDSSNSAEKLAHSQIHIFKDHLVQ